MSFVQKDDVYALTGKPRSQVFNPLTDEPNTIPRPSNPFVPGYRAEGGLVDRAVSKSVSQEIESLHSKWRLHGGVGYAPAASWDHCRSVDAWWRCYYCWTVSEGVRIHREPGGCYHCKRLNDYRVSAGWAEFINSKLPKYTDRVAKWDWFVTITFADPKGKHAAASGWTQMGWATAWKAWAAFQVWLQHHLDAYGANYDYTYFTVLELQKRGVPHFHALVHHPMLYRGGDELRKAAWFRLKTRNGFAKVEPFREGLGAEYYASKYCTKDKDVEWDFKYEKDPYSFRKYEELRSVSNRLIERNFERDGLHGFIDGP